VHVSDRRRRFGAAGEAVAAAWYEAQGYQLLDRNWRCYAGEIDLVLRKGTTLVICEVKTRSTLAYGAPAEAVTLVKRRRLRQLAASWLATHDHHAAHVRFDVASVRGHEVDVCAGAW
jgi:putative endonuclease